MGYKHLSLRTIGENTTYLGKDAAAKNRPIVWYQMGLKRDADLTNGVGLITPPSNKKARLQDSRSNKKTQLRDGGSDDDEQEDTSKRKCGLSMACNCANTRPFEGLSIA